MIKLELLSVLKKEREIKNFRLCLKEQVCFRNEQKWMMKTDMKKLEEC